MPQRFSTGRQADRWISPLGLVLLLLLAVAPATAETESADVAELAGLSLAEALDELRSRGLRLVFTSQTVKDEMRVSREPVDRTPRGALEEILAEHGLTVETGPGETLIVVPRPPEADAALGVPPGPEALPGIEEELVVRPSRVSLLRSEPVAPLGLTREEILALPHLGDDFYRSLSLLPGVTSNDVTAQFHVRGGRRDETQILLDGQELFDAYHLKDYDSALSLVDSNNLQSADLTTGGYSAEYGDRMSGVLDMTTVSSSGRTRGRLGLSVFNAHLGGAGGFGNAGETGSGEWLGEVRRGTIDLVSDLLGNEDPTYWDAYGKLRYQIAPRQSLRLNLLASGDALTFSEVDGEESSKRTTTDYGSRYGWVTHELLANDRLFIRTAGSLVGTDRDRRGVEDEEDAAFSIVDIRDTTQAALRQAWTLDAGTRHFLSWGFELRRWETSYDYMAETSLESPIPGREEDETILFRETFDESHDSFYLTDRVRLSEALTLDLGLRYDTYTQTDEELLSPRINVAWSVSERSVLRAAWGHYNQSQRTYELQVEDGETSIAPVEESEHFLLGFEHLIKLAGTSNLAVRLEAYHREIDNPRPRYENLYEPLNTFPEAEPDRVRIAPVRSESRGVELFVRARHGDRLGWFVDYSVASVEDELMGLWVPRQYDQRHTVNASVDYRLGDHWRVSLAWSFHTGLPTTPLTLVPELDEDGELTFEPMLGELNSQRLPDYHRLDLRASRSWDLGGGRLGFFVDIQNVFDRNNVAGFDIEIDDEEGVVEFETEYWAGILPSVGITFEF